MGGGGHMMGGGGFSHSAGFSGGAHFSGSPRGFVGHNTVFVGSRFGHFHGHSFFPGHFQNSFFFSAGFAFPIGYPYYYGSYYYPPYYYSYPATYAYPPASYDDNSADERRRLEYEIERLNDKINRLNTDRQGGADHAAPESLNNKTALQSHKSILLVFRDKHIQEVNNYAVVGNTLWIFAEDRAKKVPLKDLDLIATLRLNDERGVDFILPPTPRKGK